MCMIVMDRLCINGTLAPTLPVRNLCPEQERYTDIQSLRENGVFQILTLVYGPKDQIRISWTRTRVS